MVPPYVLTLIARWLNGHELRPAATLAKFVLLDK
jgi:hypothetical protein